MAFYYNEMRVKYAIAKIAFRGRPKVNDMDVSPIHAAGG